MNTKNNRKRQFSVQKIQNTFISLLDKKDISEITISEICFLSDIGRSTFYSNFDNIYDLAKSIKRKLEYELKNYFDNSASHEYSAENFLKLFIHIKNNKQYYKAYFILGFDFDEDEVYKSCDKDQMHLYYDDKYIDYHLAFFKSGLNAVIKQWLKNDCKESPEEISYIIESEYKGKFN